MIKSCIAVLLPIIALALSKVVVPLDQTVSQHIVVPSTRLKTANWTGFKYAYLDFAPAGKQAEIVIRVWDQQNQRVSFKTVVAPGKKNLRWLFPIFHLPYTACQDWPLIGGLQSTMSGGTLNTSAIARIELESSAPIRFIALGLDGQVQHAKWVDKYGQNSLMEWTGKIHSDEELKSADKAEELALNKSYLVEKRDKYQGWLNGPKQPATGFFYTKRLQDRWWFVDPEGHLFFSTGFNAMGYPGARMDESVQAAYSWLPEAGGRFAAASGRFPSLYKANLIRKWGDDFDKRFKDRALKRLRSWGFTSIGNWSADELTKTHSLPYCTIGPQTWELTIPFLVGDIPDVFHPQFESQAMAAATNLTKYKDDPWVIGHFLDNELSWDAVPYVVLSESPNLHARKEWIRRLKNKYKSIDGLNRVWGTKAKDFDSLRLPDSPNELASQDVREYRGVFADRFYKTWVKAMKKADPNHLVLGSRLPWVESDILTACAKYCDVVSINHYRLQPDLKNFDRYYRLAQKPLLIGEYGFDSLDAGLLTAYVPVENQTGRGKAFQAYTESIAERPYFVGSHYFQYIDEPITGRDDKETSFNGFVSVADVPYGPLVAAARQVNGRIYKLHGGYISNRR